MGSQFQLERLLGACRISGADGSIVLSSEQVEDSVRVSQGRYQIGFQSGISPAESMPLITFISSDAGAVFSYSVSFLDDRTLEIRTFGNLIPWDVDFYLSLGQLRTGAVAIPPPPAPPPPIAAGGVLTVSATAPLTSSGGANPNISASYNAPNGILQLDGAGLVPAAQLSFAAINAKLAVASAPISVNAQRITNLGAPVAASDAATKAYVDALPASLVQSVTATAPISSSGGNNPNISATYNAPNAICQLDGAGTVAAAQLSFNAINAKLALATAAIAVNGQKVTNLGAPTVASDAATKAYVDSVSGVSSVTATAPLTSSGGANPNISATYNAANGICKLDGAGTVAAAQMSFGAVNTTLGAATATINVNGQKITNLGAPTVASDAATKAYVDAAGGGVSSVTATAPLTSSGGANPNIDASYNAANGICKLDGAGTVAAAQMSFGAINTTLAGASAPIAVNGQKITNLGTPTVASDATTKAYVDALPFGVSSVTATAPLTSSGGANPNIDASYNAANGICKLDGSGHVTQPVTVLFETSGPTNLTLAGIADGTFFTRSAGTVVGTLSENLLSTAAASISANNQKIISLGTPTAASDATTKAYVDGLIQGVLVKAPVRLATAAALPLNTYNNGAAGVGATLTANAFGALSVDGLAVAVGDRILVKNEATSANDGIYTVTATGGGAAFYVLTRSTDMNLAAEFPGAYTIVIEGTANTNRGFTLIADPDTPFVIGTTSQTWNQFTGVGDITAGNGISITGNTISVATTLPDNYTFSAAGTAASFTNNVTIGGILQVGSITAAGGAALPITGLNSSTWQVTGGTLTVQTTSNNLTVQTVTTGTLAVTSAGACNISALAASTWQTTSANLTIQTVTSGTLAVTSAGAANISASAASTWQVTSANLTIQTVTTGTLAVTSAGACNISALSASTWQTTSANLTIQTVTSGTLAVTSAGACNISALAASTWQTTSANLTIQTVTSGTLAVTSAGAANISASAASTWQVTAANLTVQTVTSGTLAITSAGACNISAVAASTWQTTSAALTVQTVTSGTLSVLGAGAVTITAAAASTWSTSAGALTITAATTLNLGTATTTSVLLCRAGQATTIQGGARFAQDMRWQGVLSPSSITGTQNNYAPTNGSQNVIIRQALSGAATITGLSIGQNTGTIVEIYNLDTTNNITITHLDGGSSAANQFSLPAAGSITIGPLAGRLFWYDGTSSVFRVLN